MMGSRPSLIRISIMIGRGTWLDAKSGEAFREDAPATPLDVLPPIKGTKSNFVFYLDMLLLHTCTVAMHMYIVL